MFSLSYKQGGLTQNQFVFLAKAAADRRYDDQRFQAALHGAKLDSNKPASAKNPDGFLFGDPEDYAHMSPEEQQTATDKLIQALKGNKIPMKVMEKADGG